MYNLKGGKGTYKGIIGECMFKLTRQYLILTKFFNKNKYFQIFGDKLSDIEKRFIEINWYSIDGIEFDYSCNPRKVVLFEIKTLNSFLTHPLGWLPKITSNTYNIYNEALKLGFDVKVAIVWLNSNWYYEVEILNFNDCKFSIDKPKKYDKTVLFNNETLKNGSNLA